MSHRIITRKVIRNIKVDATDAELLACGQAAAEFSKKLGKIEADKKEAMDSFKEAIKAEEGKLESALTEIRDRKINVMNAECVEEWDANEGKYRLVWNGRLVEERAMNTEEKKQHVDNLFNMQEQREAARARAQECPDDIKQVMQAEKSVKTKHDFGM